MANKTKFGFGSSANLEQAIQSGKLNARDIILLDEDTDNPKFGWIKRNGEAVILIDEKADLSKVEADIAELETELATKLDVATVETMIDTAIAENVIEVVEF